MTPSDSCLGPAAVMNSLGRSRRTPTSPPLPRQVSQVPRRICRHPPSPFTPESPIAAHAHCFAVGAGFTQSGGLATLTLVTRPNRVHAYYALRLTPLLPWAPTKRSPSQPPRSLHGERALTMVSTFQLTRFARLAWRTRFHRSRRLRSQIC